MAKGGGSNTAALLNLCGIIFFLAGVFHALRYFMKFEFKIGGFELTYLGSLVIGAFALLLSFMCFTNAKK